MPKTIHMAMSIGGLLTNWPDSELAKIFNKPGQRHRGSTYRKELQRRYEAGERYLPMNYPECEGWSYVTGCPGHEIEKEDNTC